jgi:DNA-binding MarR family transcriptional regulator
MEPKMSSDDYKYLFSSDAWERFGSERIGHLTRQCARGFNRSLTIRLAEHEVSFGQWLFLRILWKKDGITQKQLSDISNLTEPTVHDAIVKLESQGIVERRTLPGNKRKLHVFMTPKGRCLKDTLEPLAIETNNRALSGIDQADQDRLKELLILMLVNLESDEIESVKRGLRFPATRQKT